MIIREWHARALPAAPDAYPEHFRTVVVPQLRGVTGFLGATLTRRRTGSGLAFTVLTRWRSMDAIRAFAGSAMEQAVVEPGAIAALAEYDDTVCHHEVIAEVVVPSPGP
ncbi:MAG: antibiotic biosynthesis monooxygenase [Acetobacteraceae bacterium]